MCSCTPCFGTRRCNDGITAWFEMANRPYPSSDKLEATSAMAQMKLSKILKNNGQTILPLFSFLSDVSAVKRYLGKRFLETGNHHPIGIPRQRQQHFFGRWRSSVFEFWLQHRAPVFPSMLFFFFLPHARRCNWKPQTKLLLLISRSALFSTDAAAAGSLRCPRSYRGEGLRNTHNCHLLGHYQGKPIVPLKALVIFAIPHSVKAEWSRRYERERAFGSASIMYKHLCTSGAITLKSWIYLTPTSNKTVYSWSNNAAWQVSTVVEASHTLRMTRSRLKSLLFLHSRVVHKTRTLYQIDQG